MHPIKFSYTPADDDLTGFVSNATGATWALSATTPADSLAHLVIITNDSATDHSAKTALLTGTDADGIAQTETLSLPAASVAVTSTKYFATLTSVVPSATIGADTMDVGWTDDIVGPTFPLNWRQEQFHVSLGVNISGTIDYTVQHTFDRLHPQVNNTADAAPSTFTWWPHASLVTNTADADGNYAFPVTATRLLINSLTAGATIAFHIVQGN